MDAFAKGLLIAHEIIKDKALSKLIDERYKSYKTGIGAKIMAGKIGLADIEKWILKNDKPVLESGRQELLENILNSYIFK
jgi:xylose isomerase